MTTRSATSRTTAPSGSYNTFNGQPDVIGATTATWSYELTLPHEGEWTRQATAGDTAGRTTCAARPETGSSHLDRRTDGGGVDPASRSRPPPSRSPSRRAIRSPSRARRRTSPEGPGSRSDSATRHPREPGRRRHLGHRRLAGNHRISPVNMSVANLRLVLHDALQPGAGHLRLPRASDRRRRHRHAEHHAWQPHRQRAAPRVTPSPTP